MTSLVFILSLLLFSNLSLAIPSPQSDAAGERKATPQVDLGYEIHTGFLNVQLHLTLNANL